MQFKITIILLATLIPLLNSTKYDYYWRDYYGEIPDDAIPGGLDRMSNPTYIVQVYILDRGILTTRLYPGDKSVSASGRGVHSSDVFIKILCSNRPEKFSWVPTTSSRVHIDSIGKHLVVGGSESGKILNIGRVAYQGEVIVGKVCTFNIGSAKLYFPFKQEEVDAESYEILIYSDDDSIIINNVTYNK